MKDFKVNPLNVIGGRQVNRLLPHMTIVPITSEHLSYNMYSIVDWIEDNLKGRFWIGWINKLDSDNSINAYNVVAFENAHEATLFLLSCPHLAKSK